MNKKKWVNLGASDCLITIVEHFIKLWNFFFQNDVVISALMYYHHMHIHLSFIVTNKREGESTRIISNESNSSPSTLRNSKGIDFWWIHQVISLGGSGFVEVPITCPKQIEAKTMQMHRMILWIPNTSSLEHYLHPFTILYDFCLCSCAWE